MDIQPIDQHVDTAGIMRETRPLKDRSLERANLGFEEAATSAFSFLEEMGFRKTQASPTYVRFERENLGANVFHGRQSYEIGFEVDHAKDKYSVSEIIRVSDPRKGGAYRNSVATTPSSVVSALRKLSEQVRQYALSALRGEPATFVALDRQRKEWSEELALKTKLSSLKPRAEAAFRAGHYTKAAELYDQIRAGLTPAETKRAILARKRASNGG